jgi:hypothetical protein
LIKPYSDFLRGKEQFGEDSGFEPMWMPDFLFDFQRALVEWATRKGRAAIFADCGMGKTPMQLVWAENVARFTGGRVLIVTPLAVGAQTVREAEKFGIEAHRSLDGKPAPSGLTVTNYERLHHFTATDFAGVVCDESSILKNFDGVRRGIVTEFLRTRPYRLLCTATAAPNDHVELGTAAEALGAMGYVDMLNRFFKNEQNTSDVKVKWRTQGGGTRQLWRFKKHAEIPFWRWVCSWARALRRPSDLGFDDGRFVLPPLIERDHVVETSKRLPGELFPITATTLYEQRQERRMTIDERCGRVAELVNGNSSAVVWCHLNDESALLERLIPGAVQVSGADSDERKESIFLDFADRQIRVLVTKPRIGAFGLNWQHCSHMTFFPSHSFEQYYQGVRRCWRFGQENPVTVDVVTTEGERKVLENLQRKATAADAMFSHLVAHMNDALRISGGNIYDKLEERPSWL